ncbi:MAG: leucyl/phenylalanyl-tRNA--protein transferase [Synechococcaceae cyanobacterium RL_1_2]|nr:leucyl/phenylalanyl-tRNA--protein transferase [Synechococcaceae cyanobacterium RL_1_2]
MTINVSEIIKSYAQGYFLMAGDEGDLNWYSSRKRAIMPLDDRFHYPKSLQRQINQNRFEVKINHDFEGVCRGCADRETTWISEQLMEIYFILHQHGWAHSFETWQGDQLAGGLMGIVIGGAFIGESMFYHIPEGSKVAMVKLVEHLRARKFTLFDVQIQNPHLERFGAHEIYNHTYNELLAKAVSQSCRFV